MAAHLGRVGEHILHRLARPGQAHLANHRLADRIRHARDLSVKGVEREQARADFRRGEERGETPVGILSSQ